MPGRWWKHACPCAGPEREEEACARCGGTGEDLGWRITAAEREQAFMWGTGFARPAEDDRSAAAEAIRARLVSCGLCDGAGIVQPDGRKDAWAWCPRCHGMGSALDGEFVIRPPGEDIAAAVAPRICSTDGYIHRYRHGRSIRRDLDATELAKLHDWLREQGFCHPASMLPAILCEDTGRMAVGPSFRTMLALDGTVRRSFDALNDLRRGYVDLATGTFLDREHAARIMRWRGRAGGEDVLLDPERLPYHADVPCGVIRWEGIRTEERGP